MTTLAELTTPMTVEEAKASIYSGLAASGVRTTTWKPGATARTIIAVVALVLAAFSRLQSAIAKGGFLETATGQWLTLVAWYVYGITRTPGTFASGTLRFANASGGVYAGAIGDLVVRSSSTNKTYRNTAAFSIGALATAVDIPFAATELGSSSTAPALTIDELVTTLSGVTVSNIGALVGTDEELDLDLRARCAAKLGTLSPNGARDAYDFVARSAVRSDGTPIGVTRVLSVPDGVGGVDVYVATPSGGVTGTSGDPATDLGAIAAEVESRCEPLAVTARLHTATSAPIAVTYSVWVRASSLTDADIEESIEDALLAFLSSQPIGGDTIDAFRGVSKSAIEACIDGAFAPGTVLRRVVSVPAADVPLVVPQAPVLSGTPIATITRIGGVT